MRPSLHDATLLAIEYRWSTRSVEVRVKTSGGEDVLHFGEVVRMEVPQLQPWGPSTSINSITADVSEGAVRMRYAIQMQSGDVIVIESGAEEDWLGRIGA